MFKSPMGHSIFCSYLPMDGVGFPVGFFFHFCTMHSGKKSLTNQENAYSKDCEVMYLLKSKTSVDLVEFNSHLAVRDI